MSCPGRSRVRTPPRRVSPPVHSPRRWYRPPGSESPSGPNRVSAATPEALSKGELGYSRARALTRVATCDNEANLLEIGLHGTAAHVEKFVRLYRQATQANETERADALTYP